MTFHLQGGSGTFSGFLVHIQVMIRLNQFLHSPEVLTVHSVSFFHYKTLPP